MEFCTRWLNVLHQVAEIGYRLCSRDEPFYVAIVLLVQHPRVCHETQRVAEHALPVDDARNRDVPVPAIFEGEAADGR